MLAASNEAMQTAPAFLLSSSPFFALEREGEREQVEKTLLPLISSLPFAPKPRYLPLFRFPSEHIKCPLVFKKGV
jgi:hypothetical protein